MLTKKLTWIKIWQKTKGKDPMKKLFLMILVFNGLFISCGGEERSLNEQQAILSLAPDLGKSDGMDSADNSCQVVLRWVGRYQAEDGNGFAKRCLNGVCNWIWKGLVAVDENVPDGVTVHVLYHLISDANWYEVVASPTGNINFNYREYEFTMSDNLFGESSYSDENVIEMVAFLRYSDGRRLFDHNTFRGDFENAQLSAQNDFSGYFGSCQPVVGTIFFSPSYSQDITGQLHQGGFLQIFYMPERLPDCRNTHNGYPCWDMLAHGFFSPGGEEFSGSVIHFLDNNGTPTNEVSPQPLTVRIPQNAQYVEIWFENFSGCGSSCRAWDSNYGANYRFDIWPPLEHPRCQNIEKDNLRIRGEDVRMVHNEPYCLDYDLSGQYDANFCEFWPQDLGLGYVGHYGIPFRWMFVNLRMGNNDGKVMAAGLFVSYHDNKIGSDGVRFALGNEVEPGLWRAGFAYNTWSYDPSNQRDYTIGEFAFFIDVRRPNGEVVRLWQSHGGQNFRMEDIYSYPTYSEGIPYGNIQWADQSSVIFDSKRSCAQ